jgi:hypothetical protein
MGGPRQSSMHNASMRRLRSALFVVLAGCGVVLSVRQGADDVAAAEASSYAPITSTHLMSTKLYGSMVSVW